MDRSPAHYRWRQPVPCIVSAGCTRHSSLLDTSAGWKLTAAKGEPLSIAVDAGGSHMSVTPPTPAGRGSGRPRRTWMGRSHDRQGGRPECPTPRAIPEFAGRRLRHGWSTRLTNGTQLRQCSGLVEQPIPTRPARRHEALTQQPVALQFQNAALVCGLAIPSAVPAFSPTAFKNFCSALIVLVPTIPSTVPAL